jgi:CheY-like chemotaxis protein
MSKILLAEDDAWVSRTLALVLRKRGHDVDVVKNGEEALARTYARRPDLLITDALMPVLDGWSLVRKLRSETSFSSLPIIVLTALSSPEDRIRAFRLGADDFVTKPFSYEELDLRVKLALRRSPTGERARTDGTASLHGRLAHVTLPSLLILIDQERKTGHLCVRGERGEFAELMVRQGRVIQARLHDRPDVIGAACVFHALRWRDGEFEFFSADVDGMDEIEMPTTQLLLEGARLLDEDSR